MTLKRIRTETGFSLLEVLVAMAILGIGLGISMQLFSGSLRAVQKSGQYTDAVFLARHKMEEWLLKNPIEEGWENGDFTGDFSNFSWNVEVKPYPGADEFIKGKLNEDSQVLLKTMQIKVNVNWQEGEKEYKVSLVTLRISLSKETLFLS